MWGVSCFFLLFVCACGCVGVCVGVEEAREKRRCSCHPYPNLKTVANKM